MAILIADSGSTKTDWICLTGDDESTQIEVQTVGLNPFHVSDNEIRGVLTHDVLPQLGDSNVEAVYFYGSGVRPEVEGRVEGLLRESFPDAQTVQAHSDLLGACRALCGDEAGIACILGTGANSCVYDGKKIVHNTPALGYILGDEGSGAVLGKHLLHDLYTGVLPHNLRLTFEKEMGLELSEIINKVPTASSHRCQSSSIATSTRRASDRWYIIPSAISSTTTCRAMVVTTFHCRSWAA